jgi:murein L,D-transpeptidase YcbB/YkuD
MRGLIPRLLLILSVVYPWLLLAAPPSSLLANTRTALQSYLDQGNNPIPVGFLQEAGQLRDLYHARGFEPLWIRADGVHPEVSALLEAIQEAAKEGLGGGTYHLGAIRPLLLNQPLDTGSASKLELLLSDAFLQLAIQHYRGRLSPLEVDPDWQLEQPAIEPGPLLIQALGQGRLRESLEALRPSHPRYLALGEALQHLWRIAEAGGWPEFPPGPNLELRDRDPRVVLLRERLRISGDLQMTPRSRPELFDAGLASAVRFFQSRHGLVVDGIVGPHTRAALNVPVERRIEQLLINLERWHWLPRGLGPRHILINMAGFELELIEEGLDPLWMRVIIGKTYRQTPAFSGRLTYLVANPTWTIPSRILKLDIAPLAQADPGYLARQGIRIFDGWKPDAPEIGPEQVEWSRIGKRHSPYRFRQDPGPDNALGRIKFMLQNPYDIYLHDTPKRALFQEAVRAFSSGCIRLEKPIELAQRLLGGEAEDGEHLMGAIEAGATRNIHLQRPVPVYFVYMTAWVDAQGVLQFRPDIYKRDSVMAVALFGSRSE